VAIINVLYLPRDDRLRTLVRTALDFVEEVYKDEILSDLEFVSFDPDDETDIMQAKHIADREGFRRKSKLFVFGLPHYHHKFMYVWVPISREWNISYLFEIVAHEVTHHAIGKLPAKDRMALATALRSDLGVEVDKMIRKRRSPSELVEEVTKAINETVTGYIVDNYFKTLEREPKTPTTKTYIQRFAKTLYEYYGFIAPPKDEREVLSVIYYKMAHHDLPNYRRAIHEAFVKLIKRFPVDVLESNPSRYRVLYSNQPVRELPL
jgi:hypothetical protein